MKTIALLMTLSFLLSLGTGVLAQETELPSPGLTPDSPFYFLETIVEEIGTFFTFGDLKKAERYANLASERLVEAKAVAEKGKPELTEKTLQRFENQLNNSIARAKKAQAEGENTEKVMEVLAKVGQVTSKHLDVLAEIYEKVPEQAKPAIENAMEASLKGHEKAVEVLKAQDALGNVPEEVYLPDNIPQEVKESIETKVQQELEIEKTLEGIDTSKSLRDICTEQGGTPEMCEEFPLEKFESFEQIESFCIEKGGPPEICLSLEAQCKEFGVTEANECFIFLSVASIKAYQSVDLEAVPLQEDSDCPRGHVTYGQTKYCCDDSDRSSPYNPDHYYIKGTLECKVIDTTDGTVTSHEVKTDSCDGDRLTEWMYDSQHRSSFETYDCPQGCEDGACIRETTEERPGTETTLEPHYTAGVSKVIIYSMPTCPHCLAAIEWLQENGIEYEVFDISQNETKQDELIEKVGQSVVPTIEVEGDILVGFTEESFSEFFGVE